MNLVFWKITENLPGHFFLLWVYPNPPPALISGSTRPSVVFTCFERLHCHKLQPKFPYRPYPGKETGSCAAFKLHGV